MEKSEQEINDIKQRYKPQIDRMDKMLLNIYSIANIRFWYACLSHFRKSEDIHQDIMQMEAFATSIIIAYGRLFGETKGTIVLKKEELPKDLLPVHNQIISLRNNRYAHHGEHSTLEKKTKIDYIDSTIIVSQEIQIDFWLGAPKEWGQLFKWLDAHMYNTLHKTLDYLTKETGIEWKSIHREPPPWIE